MEEVKYNEYLKEATEALESGAFLNVRAEGEVNTMTIGWASIGVVWRVPMFLVLVRESRYTHQLIEKAEDFTVSFPFNRMQEELKFCGTYSGRNYDKFAECELEVISGKDVDSVMIKGCDLHYECSIKYKQDMEKENIFTDTLIDCYPDYDLHTLYFGEIINCFMS